MLDLGGWGSVGFIVLGSGSSSSLVGGVVHAWVGQKLLKRYIFKSFF